MGSVTILKEAEDIIYGDREQTYGSPDKNLRAIAEFWESYLMNRGLLNEASSGILIEDVAQMMILLKLARLINAPYHRDSLVDICGYCALVDRVRKT